MKVLVQLLILVLLIAVSCKVEPGEIDYGKDGCHFCKMTIVDNQHAAELVTSKGKVFKYDAIECLVNDLKAKDQTEIGLTVVNDYNKPGDLIDAGSATFLISEGIPSPMGAFLSAFGDKEAAINQRSEKGGEIFTWEEIQSKFK